MKRLAILLAMACAPAENVEPGTIEQAATFSDTTYWVRLVGPDDSKGTLSQAAHSASARWRHATCLDIKVSTRPDVTGGHVIKWAAPEEFSEPGRVGQTNGSWSRTTMRISTLLQQPAYSNAEQAARTLSHEFFHTLARTNGHCSSGIASTGRGKWDNLEALIDECALDKVCSKQDCECYQPE